MAKKKTAKKTKVKGGLSTAEKVGIGVGITATAAAAAGAYFLLGSPNAEKNRKKVKSWMLKAKAEVLEALENAERMTEIEYQELVDMIADGYATVQGATRSEIADFRKEMKEHWRKIEKSAVAKKAKRVAKTAAKNTVKKAVRKKTAKKTTRRKK